METVVITITGPSGVGKTELERRLVQRERLRSLISFTTRRPRHHERDGIHYHFISREEAESLIESGQAVEHTEVCGEYYGLANGTLESLIPGGRYVVVLDPRGVRAMREYVRANSLPVKFISVFLRADASVLMERLVTRFINDPLMDKENFTARWNHMLDVERSTWLTMEHWDAVLPSNTWKDHTYNVRHILDDLLIKGEDAA